jgi:hypothetical protein
MKCAPFILCTILMACSPALSPYGEWPGGSLSLLPEDPFSPNRDLIIEFEGERFSHGDTLVFDAGEAGGEHTRLTLEITNRSPEDVDIHSNPGILTWGTHHHMFQIQGQSPKVIESGESIEVVIQFETTDQEIGLWDGGLAIAWGPASWERFWIAFQGNSQPIQTVEVPLLLAFGAEGAILVSHDNGQTWWESPSGWPSRDRYAIFHQGDENHRTPNPFSLPENSVYKWKNAVFTGGRFVVFGQEHDDSSISPTVAWESQDGFTWTDIPLDGVDRWDPTRGTALDNGTELFVGYRNVYGSHPSDPTIFKIQDIPDSAIKGIATDGSGAVTVGTSNTISWSIDGLSWNTLDREELENDLGEGHYYDVAYGNGRYVAVGDHHRSLVSDDGGRSWHSGRWEPAEEDFEGNCARPDNWCQIRWDGNQFIVYERGHYPNHDTKRWVSTDGREWRAESVNRSLNDWTIAPLQGLTLSSGGYPYRNLYLSSDGINIDGILNRRHTEKRRERPHPALYAVSQGSFTVRKDQAAHTFPGYIPPSAQ